MPNRKCCVKGCGRNNQKNKDASFFLFPKVRQEEQELTQTRLYRWRKRVNIPDAEFNQNTVVCDKHFVLGNIFFLYKVNAS
jgi:predicted ester cyclase